MNTPNKLTLLRVILIPIFMLFYMMKGEAAFYLYAALFVFIAAALTDQLDGYLARKNNQVTTFGKLMDPLADKMLIMAALICFVEFEVKYITSWVVVIILSRELIVSGVRMIAMGENTVIAASIWGKAKTVSQLVLVIAVMVFEAFCIYVPQAQGICDILVCILTVVATVLTIFSGFDYVWKNRGLLTFK